MYIYNLYDKKTKLKTLGEVAPKILYYFIDNPTCSIYKCYKLLEEEYKIQGKTINYKNIHLRVKNLEQNGLIEKINRKNDESKHGAVYYRISSFGIFYALLNNLHCHNKKIITEHADNPLYRLFIFPYFSCKTIEKLYDENLIQRIFEYLHRCCSLVDEALDQIHIAKLEGIKHVVLDTFSLFSEKYYEKNFLQLGFIQVLQQQFKIDWLTNKNEDDLKLVHIENDKKIRISDTKNELLLEIVPSKQILTISENNRALCVLCFDDYSRLNPSRYFIYTKTPIDLTEYLKERDIFEKEPLYEVIFNNRTHTNISVTSLSNELRNLVPSKEAMNLGYTLLRELGPIFISKRIRHNFFEGDQDKGNLELLASDEKFSRLLSYVKKDTDRQYNSFLAFRPRS